jgi:hypothetical protein
MLMLAPSVNGLYCGAFKRNPVLGWINEPKVAAEACKALNNGTTFFCFIGLALSACCDVGKDGQAKFEELVQKGRNKNHWEATCR